MYIPQIKFIFEIYITHSHNKDTVEVEAVACKVPSGECKFF